MNQLIRYVPGVVGALILFLCMPVMAQNASPDCQVEISRAKANPVSIIGGKSTAKEVEDDAKQYLGLSCSLVDLDADRKLVQQNESTLRKIAQSEMERPDVLRLRLTICVQRAVINRCSSGARGAESNQGSRPNTPAGGNDMGGRTTPPAAKAEPARQSTSNEENAKQKARSEADSAQARAKSAQVAVDKARQGKAKRHHPEGEAHQCLTLKKAGLYGGFNNSCAVPVTYFFCQYQPKKDSWGEWFDCEKGKVGLWSVKANSGATGHTNGAVMNYWFACKEGFEPADVEFVSGQGLRGRCVK